MDTDMKVNFLVSVELPDGVDISEMRDYVLDAVTTMVGSYPLDDPMFDLDRESVVVVTVNEEKDRRERERLLEMLVQS